MCSQPAASVRPAAAERRGALRRYTRGVSGEADARDPDPGGEPGPAERSAEREELRLLALDVASEAAELAARRRAEGVRIAATKSSLTDVVTEADREVEALVRGRLARERPRDGFLGEESGSLAGSSGLSWIVDPIDGTVNYLYGLPHCAVSVAVAAGRVDAEADPVEHEALAGAVVNIMTGEAFSAARGGGARCGERRLAVSRTAELSRALVATGYPYGPELRRQQARTWAAFAGEVRDLRRMGAAALDLCAVADGRVDLYFERDIKPWDHAAGALVAREAGALVKGLGERREGRDMVLAGAAPLVEAFEPVLRAALRRADALG